MSPRSWILALTRNPRIGGFLSMSGGTLFAQLVTVAVLPVLSRLYSPEDFGQLALVLAISAVVTPAVALRLDAAVLLPKSNRQARAIVSAALLVILVVSALWALLAELVATAAFQTDSIAFLSWWVFGTTLMTGLFSLLSQVAVRDRRYGAVAVRSVYQSVTTAASQSLFGLLAWGAPGLLAGTLLGRAAGIGGLLVRGRRYVGRHRMRDLPPLWREYWRFPIVFAPSAVLNSLGLQLPVIVLTAAYGLEFGGQLGMAERIVAIPITLIGTAAGGVVVGEVARMRREGELGLWQFFIRVSGALSVVSVVSLGLIGLLAAPVIPWVLGAQWDATVPLVQVLALTGVVRLVATPIAGVITVFQRARANVTIDLVRVTLMTLAVFIVTYLSLSEIMAAVLLYGSLAVVYIITWTYVMFLIRGESNASKRATQ